MSTSEALGVSRCLLHHRYKHMDMGDLEAQLKAADEAGARVKLIATGQGPGGSHRVRSCVGGARCDQFQSVQRL